MASSMYDSRHAGEGTSPVARPPPHPYFDHSATRHDHRRESSAASSEENDSAAASLHPGISSRASLSRLPYASTTATARTDHSAAAATAATSMAGKRTSRWSVVVVPPPMLPHSPPPPQVRDSANGYGASGRFAAGIILPLQPSLNLQVAAVVREFSLPSSAGITLHLCLSHPQPPSTMHQPLPYGYGAPHPSTSMEMGLAMYQTPPPQVGGGPRLTDDSWLSLFGWAFDEERPPSLQPSHYSHSTPLPLGLMSCIGLPIAARLEFDIDTRKARWLTSWVGAAVAAPASALEGMHATPPQRYEALHGTNQEPSTTPIQTDRRGFRPLSTASLAGTHTPHQRPAHPSTNSRPGSAYGNGASGERRRRSYVAPLDTITSPLSRKGTRSPNISSPEGEDSTASTPVPAVAEPHADVTIAKSYNGVPGALAVGGAIGGPLSADFDSTTPRAETSWPPSPDSPERLPSPDAALRVVPPALPHTPRPQHVNASVPHQGRSFQATPTINVPIVQEPELIEPSPEFPRPRTLAELENVSLGTEDRFSNLAPPKQQQQQQQQQRQFKDLLVAEKNDWAMLALSPLKSPRRSPMVINRSQQQMHDALKKQGPESILLAAPTRQDMAKDVIDCIVEAQTAGLKRHGKFVFAISGGSLPLILADTILKDSRIQWETWKVFFADEKLVPLDHADSNFKSCMELIFSHTPMKRSQIISIMNIPSEGMNLDEISTDMAAIYEAQLLEELPMSEDESITTEDIPSFDLILLGMGEDGHTASLFPHHRLLDEHDYFVTWLNDSPQSPSHRLTLTLPVLNAARKVAFVVSGTAKQSILANTLEHSRCATYPCGLVTPMLSSVTWFVDITAAGKTKFPNSHQAYMPKIEIHQPINSLLAQPHRRTSVRLGHGKGNVPLPIIQVGEMVIPTLTVTVGSPNSIDDEGVVSSVDVTPVTAMTRMVTPVTAIDQRRDVRGEDQMFTSTVVDTYPSRLSCIYPAIYPHVSHMLYQAYDNVSMSRPVEEVSEEEEEGEVVEKVEADLGSKEAVVNVAKSTDELSNNLASFVIQAQDEALERHAKFVIALSGGSLPQLLADGLLVHPGVKWDSWRVFFADERLVPLNHSCSNYALCFNTLFNHTSMDRSQISTIMDLPMEEGDIESLNAEAPDQASWYESRILQELPVADGSVPSFDLILLGMGGDGHTCSLFPLHDLLNESDYFVTWLKDSPKSPSHRITLTLCVLNAAQQVAFVVVGEEKQQMVADVLEHPPSTLRPASLVQPTLRPVQWFMDQEASAARTVYPTITTPELINVVPVVEMNWSVYPQRLYHIYPAVYPHVQDLLYTSRATETCSPPPPTVKPSSKLHVASDSSGNYPWNLSALYPSTYPHFDLYPTVTFDIVKPLNDDQIKLKHERVEQEKKEIALSYPSNLYTLYTPLYPHFDLYPTINHKMVSPRKSTPSLPLKTKMSYPWNLSQLYTPTYPHFDLYPSPNGPVVVFKKSISTTPLSLPTTTTLTYPWNLTQLYSSIYPHFDLYPTAHREISAPSPSSKVRYVSSIKFSYPWNLSRLYTPVYPHFELYSTTQESVSMPLQSSPSSITPMLTKSTSRLSYPSKLYSLYSPVYPYFDLYPTIDNLVLPKPPHSGSAKRPAPIFVEKGRSTASEDSSEWPDTPPSPDRLPSADLMGRLALSAGPDDDATSQFSLYDPTIGSQVSPLTSHFGTVEHAQHVQIRSLASASEVTPSIASFHTRDVEDSAVVKSQQIQTTPKASPVTRRPTPISIHETNEVAKSSTEDTDWPKTPDSSDVHVNNDVGQVQTTKSRNGDHAPLSPLEKGHSQELIVEVDMATRMSSLMSQTPLIELPIVEPEQREIAVEEDIQPPIESPAAVKEEVQPLRESPVVKPEQRPVAVKEQVQPVNESPSVEPEQRTVGVEEEVEQPCSNESKNVAPEQRSGAVKEEVQEPPLNESPIVEPAQRTFAVKEEVQTLNESPIVDTEQRPVAVKEEVQQSPLIESPVAEPEQRPLGVKEALFVQTKGLEPGHLSGREGSSSPFEHDFDLSRLVEITGRHLPSPGVSRPPSATLAQFAFKQTSAIERNESPATVVDHLPTTPSVDSHLDLEEDLEQPPPLPILFPFSSPTAVAEALAQFVFEAQEAALRRHERFVVALSAVALTELLMSEVVKDERMLWQHWHVWMVSDIVASPQDANHFNLIQKMFLSHVPISSDRVYSLRSVSDTDFEGAKYIPDGMDTLTDNLAEDYEQRLLTSFPGSDHVPGKAPKFDLMLLDMGQDGRTAALFPEHPLLGEHEWFVAWLGDAPGIHSHMITLSLATINASHQVVFVVMGSDKAAMLAEALNRSVQSDVPMDEDRDVPVALVKTDVRPIVWLTDEAAASKTDHPRSAFWDD